MTEQTASVSEPKAAPSQDAKAAAPDIAGVLERFKLPDFDLEGFIQSRKQDIDAAAQATSAALAGTQSIVDKQAELLKTVLSELGDAIRTFPADAAKPVELLRKQQEFANDALSSAIASMKEIADTVRESQSRILELASDRVRSSVEEIRLLATRPKPSETT